MIRPFGLHDIGLVRRLQRTGMPLAVEHLLTHPRDSLWTALTAPWPWAGVGVATFVLDEIDQGHRFRGFIQLVKRATRPEADLLHLAPASLPAATGDPPTEQIWKRLLTYCSGAAASHGLQRLYASTPVGCGEEQSLKRAGYCPYAHETIYRLPNASAAGGPLVGFRSQAPQDSWALQRLYMRSTPRLVQQAEGALTGDAGSPALSWWEPDHWHGIIWEPAGEVRGAAQVHIGRAGHWLRLWGVNDLSARELRALIEQGLGLVHRLQRTPRRALPVYATVRDYELGLSGALTGFGFTPALERTRFVKHTVAVARVTAPVALGAQELSRQVPVRTQARDH